MAYTFYTEQWPLFALYVVFTSFNVYGWLRWRKDARGREKEDLATLEALIRLKILEAELAGNKELAQQGEHLLKQVKG